MSEKPLLDLDPRCTQGVSRDRVNEALRVLGIDVFGDVPVGTVTVGVKEITVECLDRSELGDQWARSHICAPFYKVSVAIIGNQPNDEDE